MSQGQDLMELLPGPAVIEIGALKVGVQIENKQIAEDVHLLYGDYPLGEPGLLTDFDIHLRPPNLWRSFVRPQVQFFLDGMPPFLPMPIELGATMFESAVNWCVFCRILRYLILHAAVVERDGKAVIFPGHSGSGKSTLCAELVGRGWRLLSDEL
ncbi:MAG: hypothetical protein R3245_12870, partial [Kiloniellales bacterium]|nr:hypothetical protein [Kiloniellales bacterium]